MLMCVCMRACVRVCMCVWVGSCQLPPRYNMAKVDNCFYVSCGKVQIIEAVTALILQIKVKYQSHEEMTMEREGDSALQLQN